MQIGSSLGQSAPTADSVRVIRSTQPQNPKNTTMKKPISNAVMMSMLKKFTLSEREAKGYEGRKWMCSPFSIGLQTCATDAHAVIALPLAVGFEDRAKTFTGIYPLPHTDHTYFTTAELSQKVEDFPKLEKWEILTKQIRIGKSIFSILLIKKLLFVAKKMKAKKITVTRQTEPNRDTVFNVAGVEVLLMPIVAENASVLQEIDPQPTP